MKVSIVVGTRPQIIKSQPIIKELLSRKVKINIIHTGQHFDYKMSKAFFDEMKIKNPHYNLGVKFGSSAMQVSEIIKKLEKPLKNFMPDFVLVPGDTRSALASALCATRLGFRVAHVESGARSNDFTLEEEINRRIIDQCSTLLFAPTPTCFQNLKNEKVLGSIFYTGDTMYDVFLKFKKILKLKKSNKKKFVLVTIHRKNNIENYQTLSKIIKLIKKVANSGTEVIFPIHPHTKQQIKSFGISLKGIHIIEPVKYSKMLKLLNEASLLITDSGGLQKEAFWSHTPCVTFRKSTEWIETMEGKKNLLLPIITKSSYDSIKNLIKNKHSDFKKSTKFGNGKASKKIVSILLQQN